MDKLQKVYKITTLKSKSAPANKCFILNSNITVVTYSINTVCLPLESISNIAAKLCTVCKYVKYATRSKK